MKCLLRGILLLAVLSGWWQGATAQLLNPVDWQYDAEKTGEQTYKLKLTARVDSGWHIYAQELQTSGPVPTSFQFQESDGIKLLGKTQPLEPGKTKEDAVQLPYPARREIRSHSKQKHPRQGKMVF